MYLREKPEPTFYKVKDKKPQKQKKQSFILQNNFFRNHHLSIDYAYNHYTFSRYFYRSLMVCQTE